MSALDNFIQKKVEKAFAEDGANAECPYAKSSKWYAIWRNHFNELAYPYPDEKFEPFEQPADVLAIIEENDQSSLRAMMMVQYAKQLFTANEYWQDARDIPNFEDMSDVELLEAYTNLVRSGAQPVG